MRKIKLGLLLIVMMFGHNFVLNQTQALQTPLESTHNITVTEFNLLYSIPSAVAILVIIPMGFLYDHYANCLLILGAVLLSLGQLLITIFGSEGKPHFYQLLMTGRVSEGLGAQILYMIQGNLASSWMGKYAGMIFILPEFGQIANVFVTPWAFTIWGIRISFGIGLLTCLASSISCVLLYFHIIKYHKPHPTQEVIMEDQNNDQIVGSNSSVSPQGEGEKDKTKDSPNSESDLKENKPQKQQITIFTAGKIFWLMILLCAINECLYFPFLDNGNQLITSRFCIPYENTGFYLSLPFVSAMLTSYLGSYVLTKVQRKKLILFTSVIPLIGHGIIFLDTNCTDGPTLFGEFILVVGLCFFGMGIGSYYTVSFPGVGLAVPESIRGTYFCNKGTGYACMGFFQTISMTLIPIFSGLIIESETSITKISEGYKASSLLFVSICLSGVVVSYIIYSKADQNSFIYDDEENYEKQNDEKELSQLGTS